MPCIIITGSSGLVGTALVPFLRAQGYTVKRLVRDNVQLSDDSIHCKPSSLEGSEVIINLAGENIASGRWTANKKKQILESRVEGTKHLCQQLKKMERLPKLLISASAMGFYGDHGAEVVTENSASGNDFLAEVCRQWEEAAEIASECGIRVAKIRIGAVLSTKGGVLGRMLTPFKLGLGGVLGRGNQYMSWIMLDELVNIIDYIINHDELSGPINVATPYPVTNKEFTKVLGHLLRRPTFFPVPAFVLRLALGEMADALLLSSIRMAPTRLISSKYEFLYPTLDQALRTLI